METVTVPLRFYLLIIDWIYLGLPSCFFSLSVLLGYVTILSAIYHVFPCFLSLVGPE